MAVAGGEGLVKKPPRVAALYTARPRLQSQPRLSPIPVIAGTGMASVRKTPFLHRVWTVANWILACPIFNYPCVKSEMSHEKRKRAVYFSDRMTPIHFATGNSCTLRKRRSETVATAVAHRPTRGIMGKSDTTHEQLRPTHTRAYRDGKTN